MPERVTAILGSYDIFGKSIPGIALFFGLLPLFPEGFNSRIIIAPSFVNFVAIVFVLFLFGFVMGQAVHTFADIFERIVAWFAWRIIGIIRTLKRIRLGLADRRPVFELRKQYHSWRSEDNQAAETDDGDSNNLPVVKDDYSEDLPVFKAEELDEPEELDESDEPDTVRPEDRTYADELGLNDFRQVKPWFERRGWGIYDALASHRHLFKRNLQWYFDPYLKDRWPETKEKMVFDLFIKQIEEDDDFGIDISPERNLDDIDELYPILTSKITRDGEGRAMEFQARYSFCRSMWVVFLLIASLYAMALFSSAEWLTNTFGYLPLIRDVIADEFSGWLIGVLLGIVSIFLFGSGVYKRHFIEYLLADAYMAQINTNNDK